MVYACFEGMGKRGFSEENPNSLYIDSDDFKWDGYDTVNYEPKVNKDFPKNYLAEIKKFQDEGYTILVDTDKESLQALKDEGLVYTILIPNKQLKEEYLKRYNQSYLAMSYVTNMENQFEILIEDALQDTGAKKIILINEPNMFLKDIFEDLTL